mgnify:CR=1 FL=1
MSWIDSGDATNVYQKEHLPHIVIKYASIWNMKFDPTANISPSVLDQIKGEIINLLVRMYVLPRSYLGTLSVRRSRRSALSAPAMAPAAVSPLTLKVSLSAMPVATGATTGMMPAL